MTVWITRRPDDEVATELKASAVPDIRRREYISGGSSSGSAVAVAKGEADIAVGTDTAGLGASRPDCRASSASSPLSA
jgi:Asp-tRNA(Asn)/Glu-tRNA(Gln) amidotransferase A subunit family amidase